MCHTSDVGKFVDSENQSQMVRICSKLEEGLLYIHWKSNRGRSPNDDDGVTSLPVWVATATANSQTNEESLQCVMLPKRHNWVAKMCSSPVLISTSQSLSGLIFRGNISVI